MPSKTTLDRIIPILLLLLLTACAPEEPEEATQVPIARVTNTAVPATTSPPETPLATSAVRPDTPTPTFTAVPTQPPTTIPLPLPPLAPFPTVTPNYPFRPTKSIFLYYAGLGGDGGSETDEYFGRSTPVLIIYGDGQFLLKTGTFGESLSFQEGYMTATEMCELRHRIEATGFLDPHYQLFTQRDGGEGGWVNRIQVEETYYSFYGPDTPYLLDDLAEGVHLIANYRPSSPLTAYTPDYLILWISEAENDPSEPPALWPSELPPIADLWTDRSQHEIHIQGEWVIPIFDLFSRQLIRKVFQDGDTVYEMIARPLLPHEKPYQLWNWGRLPLDYTPVLACEDGPTLIPQSMPTATPTLTSPAAALTGQGRIVFVTNNYSEREIYVSDADGTNRLQLTNNLYFDDEPVWSPDGQRIAFTSEQTGNKDIFVMDADGRNVTQLTFSESDDYSPTWSPDGTKIAFISERDSGWEYPYLYQINADGTGLQQLFDSDRTWLPGWSPDGKIIVFISSLGKLKILHLESGTVEDLTDYSSFELSRPTWSADSSKVAVAYNLGHDVNIILHIITLTSGDIETINIPLLESATSLDWAAGGRFIIFSARGPIPAPTTIHITEGQFYDSSFNLYALDNTTNQIIQITYNQQDETSPAWWP